MIKPLPRILCQIYLLLALVAATILSPFPYSPLSLILLLIMLFITFRPLYPRLNLATIIAVIFLLPLILEPLLLYLTYTALLAVTAVQIIAAITILPVIYLLDYYLRQDAQKLTPESNIKGKHVTVIPRVLLISVMTILLVSLTINNPTLLFTSITLFLYLLGILILIIYAVPRLPLDIPTIRKRVIAGTAANISLHPVNKASIKLHSLISPVNSWVKATPREFTLDGDKTELNLAVTPPLAGPSHPHLLLSAIDPWGFIQVNQVAEPVELHVIPRAKYAEWLAMKYLEQTGPGTALATTSLPPKAIQLPKRGTEYFDSRNYQPGDSLIHIDWKHSLKLNQIIIKEYIEAGGQAAIITANLSVNNAEEADKLAFNLITTALTFASEAIPTALSIYNHQEVILTTTTSDPRETLKQTLSLVKDITLVEFPHRFLQPPNISQLKRNITLLKQATSKPAQRLLSILNFEFKAIEEATKNHPATLALSSVTKRTPPPAVIVIVSQLNHDTEALAVTLDKMSRRGFTPIPIETAKQQLTSAAQSGYGETLPSHHELPTR